MDISTISKAPREVPLSVPGRAVNVVPLTLGDWAALQQWIKDHVPSPVAVAFARLDEMRRRGVRVDRSDREALLATANAAKWPPPIGGQAWYDAIDHDPDAGRAAFLGAVIRPEHNDGMTKAGVAELARAYAASDDTPSVQADMGRLILAAFGVDEPPKESAPTTTS
jgi:hypothetical protein